MTPVWFTYLDNTFWISSGERNTKVRNILNDPRVRLAPFGPRVLLEVPAGRWLLQGTAQ